MEVFKALQILATVDLKTDNEAERTAKVKALRVVDEQMTQPLLRTTNEFVKLLEFGVFALLRMLQDSDMNVWSLAEQVLVKTVKVLESSHRDKIVAEVWKGVKGSRVEGRSRRFAIELFALYSHRTKPTKADKFREALLRNLVSIARQEDDQLLQEALSKCIDPIVTHQLAHAPLADLDPFLDELAANVRSSQGRVRRSAVSCIVALCKGHKQHLDLFVAAVRRMLNLILINFHQTEPSSPSDASSASSSALDAPSSLVIPPSDSSNSSNSSTPAPPIEIPLKPELIRKPISDHDISDKLSIAISKSSSPTLQGVLHALRQLLRLNIEFVQSDLYAMPNPMNADLGTLARIASESLRHEDNNVTVAALELLQEIFENNWQPLLQLGGTGFKARPEKDEITAFVENIVGNFETMLFDQQLRISVQVLVVACFCALSVPLPIPLQHCLKRRLPQFIELLKHSDPLLRGQAYFFIGCFMCGWLQAKSRIDWPELDVFELLGTILHSTMQDDSAIAAKMACEGLSICTEPLLASEYAFFVPYMLQHLMCLPSDAYLLLKSKTFSLMSKIDYRMISYLEKSMKKLKATDYKPGYAQQVQTAAVNNLLGEDWLEEAKDSLAANASASPNISASVATSTPSVVRLPVHLTIGNEKLQNSVVDFLVSFLQDQDPRVRHKAGSVLVKLVPHLNYSHFFDTAERRQYVVALRILDMQTSQHMSDERNNDWKEHTDWLLWKLVPKINQAVESLFLKGFYHFLRVLLEKGYTLPGQLVGIMLDQLACSNLATDLDTQLDLFVMMSHLVQHLTGSLASYTQRIFVHVLRILHILSAILSSKPIPGFKETKPGTEKDLPAGAVQGQPQYLQLWEKLQDTYRLSLSSLHGNLFDEFCISSIKAVSLIATAMGKGVVPYIEEVIGYINDHFERNTEDVLECIQALLEAALSDTDLVHERGISTILEPLPRVDEPFSDAQVHNIVDLTTPTYESLLNPVIQSHLRSHKTQPLRSPPSSSAANASESQAAVAKDQKKKIFKMFEPTLKRCIDHYLCTQAVHRRRTILQLLTHIISSLRLVLDYRTLDRDASFIRQVHGHLMRTSALHNEILRSKSGSSLANGAASSASATKDAKSGEPPGTPTRTAPMRPGTPSGSPLGLSTDSASATAAAAQQVNEGTALQLSEIAATQLAFLYEMLFHCGIAWNGADLMGLIPLAFTSSWQPSSNQTSFENIANVLFTENLLKQWRECPKQHTLGRPAKMADRGSAPPASGMTRAPSSTLIPSTGTPNKPDSTTSASASSSATASPAPQRSTDEWINDEILGNMRNQFVTQLLMLLPDPRAINLLVKVLDLLQSFKNNSPYLEISSVIHDGLITILLDEGTTVLFAKSGISDLLSMFLLIDRLPIDTLNLNAIAATFVSIAKFSLHHIGVGQYMESPFNADQNSTPPSTPPRSPEPSLLIIEPLVPISAVPKAIKSQFGLSTPERERRAPSRPLTPADLGIVSPLPVSPAHKEETLRERSKRRVVDHERRYYASMDRAWLPRCAFLLRILSRFSEAQILAALSNPVKTDLADFLPTTTNIEQQEGIASAFSLLLTSLLERGAQGIVKGVSSEYYEDWTRQVCILTHLITHIVDSPARKTSEPSSNSVAQDLVSSTLPDVMKPSRQTINFFDESETGEVDLLVTKPSKKKWILPDAMAAVLSSLDLNNLLYGAVQSKFSAMAFTLCKLFQNLHLPEALQSLLKFATPTPTKSAKMAAGAENAFGTSASASLVGGSSLPWTWYREVLHMASFSAFCRVTCSSATKAELSARREVIANLLKNHDHLERITHQAHNSDIKRLFTIYPVSPEQQSHILQFIRAKMQRNRIKETLEPHNIHQLLLLATYLPPTEQVLNLLLEHFITSTYISVVIAAEQYFLNLLSRLEITITPLPTDGSEALEVMVKRLLSLSQPHLRTTFCKKLAKSGWLIHVARRTRGSSVSTSASSSTPTHASPTPLSPATLVASPFSSAMSGPDLLSFNMASPVTSPTASFADLPVLDSTSPLPARSVSQPDMLIEDLVMEHIAGRKHSQAELIELLCASMSSPTLFRRMLKLLGSQPVFLAHCLADPQGANVKEDILLAIASTLNQWFAKNSLVVAPELDAMLTVTEDQTAIGRRGPPAQAAASQQPPAPEVEDLPLTHIHAEDWRANVELLRLVVSAIEQFGSHPVLAIEPTEPEADFKKDSHDDGVDVASASPNLLDLDFSHETKGVAGERSQEELKAATSEIKKAFGAASLVSLVSNSLRKLLVLHETKTSVLSSFDVVVVMRALRYLFERHRFSVSDLKSHPQLRKLIYRLYSCNFILFKPTKKLILDYSTSAQMPAVLDFFYDFVRTMASRAESGVGAEVMGFSQEQRMYCEVVQQFVKSSPSLEYAVFPLQDDPINFDYNNEPLQLLSQFSHLINSLHFNYASTFSAVWKQLMEGMDEEIPAVATSEAIKVVTVRAMTSMLLRAGYKATDVVYDSRSASTGEKGFKLGIPLLSLATLRASNTTSPKFLGMDLSNMLTVFINTVLKPLIEPYVKCTTNEPAVGKECLKALTLLSDHFTNAQWLWLHEYAFSILDSQPNIWDEDPLMRNYLLVAAAKSTAVLWPTLQPTPPSGSSVGGPTHPMAVKLQKLLVFHIQNMKLREHEIHAEDRSVMPMAKNLVLLALHYVIQAKTMFDVRADTVIWPWLEMCAKSPSASLSSPTTTLSGSASTSNLAPSAITATNPIEQRILNTSALVRFLAKTCESLLPTSKEVEGRERAQVMTQHQLTQIEDDFDMAHMEEIKTLFAQARKSLKAQPTQLYADELVRSVIPHKMMQYFSAETIISNLISELAKPEAGAQSIAFVLHQVIMRLHATLADNLDDMLSKWILMTLPHFTVNSAQRMAQAQWSLTSLFLSSSRNPTLRTLFHELTKTSESAIDPMLFVLAGLDFYTNRNLGPEAKAEFLNAFNVPHNQLFQSLYLQLQALQPTASSSASAPINLLD
jgi:hypothetical protein